jgi:fructose-1,6-bisphosphatase/sedoheptulose 1,7-bisphosphatase-like protein
VKDDAQKERMQAMGIANVNRIYTAPELAPGRNLVFVACGVTGGDLLQGVRFTGDGVHTQSIVMNSNPARVRFVDTTHLENKPDVKVRFR